MLHGQVRSPTAAMCWVCVTRHRGSRVAAHPSVNIFATCGPDAYAGTAPTRSGSAVDPTNEQFTGLIFKLQANMDPKHRDKVAFVRVVSGVQHSLQGSIETW